jgi:uroporphyrin-III C-methyltransferase
MRFSTAIDLQGRRVVVCGGTPAALGVVTELLQCKAAVTIVATELATSLLDLADRSLITWLPRQPTAEDLAGAALVVVATGSPAEDHALSEAARERNVAVVPVDAPDSGPRSDTGRVILIGGGPGDPGLLTVAGLNAIRSADVIICDRLAPLAALQEARPDAEIIDVGKIPRGQFTSQERINELLVEHASQGRVVARLKGGDNFVFGRGGEEWQACTAAGIAVEVIPGVSSALAAPALAGIPLTHRNLTQGFTVVSGHLPPDDPGSTLDWAALARGNTTLVILMGVATLGAIAAALQAAGLNADVPAATIADAGLPSQRVVRGTLGDIAARTREAGIKPPAVTVIGPVAGFSPDQSG